MHTPIQEISLRLAQGSKVQAVADALFPVLEDLKESIFQEFAHTPPENSLHLAKCSGKASVVDTLLRSLSGQIEDGKLASEELQRGGH